MESLKVQFVKGGDNKIDLLFRDEEQLLRIHEKWIDFQRIHEGDSCEMSRLARDRLVEMEAFSCDHVVEDLFELVLNNIRRPLKLDQSESVTLRRIARERIRQIPRLTKVSRTGRPNELEVSYESMIISKKYGANILYHVTLHKKKTCWSKKGELLHQAGTYTFPGGYPANSLTLTYSTRSRAGHYLSRKQLTSNRGNQRTVRLCSSSYLSKRRQSHLQRAGPQGRVLPNDCSNWG